MPTYEADERFFIEFNRLSSDRQDVFLAAVRKLVHDLRAGRPRKGLRVKRVRSQPGVWEMTWADDGRATFS